MLNKSELDRYNRQLIIPDFGAEGQKKLKTAHVFIVGMGGLGCASATYLTAAGVGHITIVDFDIVELSDFNRQILYCDKDVGKKKVIVAKTRLSELNPLIQVIPVFEKINKENVVSIINGAQVVVDGLDNPAARLLVNSACVKYKTPYIFGGVSHFRGMITTIIPGQSPCLSCFHPEGSSAHGVLGVIPAIIANLQALEAIKILIGHGPSLAGRLLFFNGNEMKFRILDIKRNEECKVCSLLPVV